MENQLLIFGLLFMICLAVAFMAFMIELASRIQFGHSCLVELWYGLRRLPIVINQVYANYRKNRAAMDTAAKSEDEALAELVSALEKMGRMARPLSKRAKAEIKKKVMDYVRSHPRG